MPNDGKLNPRTPCSQLLICNLYQGIKGMPTKVLFLYATYSFPKNATNNCSSLAILSEKNFHSTIAYPTKHSALPSNNWVPSPHQKNPKYDGCRRYAYTPVVTSRCDVSFLRCTWWLKFVPAAIMAAERMD